MSAFTMEMLEEAIGKYRDLLQMTQLVPCDECYTLRPWRVHKRTKNQTETYHRRVQKKWLKRWGKRAVPTAFNVGFGTILCHPSLISEIQRETGRIESWPE